MLASLLFVGALGFHACQNATGYYCASVTRPLDPAGEVPGTIDIAVTYRPHSGAGIAAGTIVAAEGGPGYPSGGSRDAYATMLGPLLTTHDLLMMDDRGTGASGAIDCGALQSAPVMILANVTRCGEQLGTTSDLYGSALAADDLDAILQDMHVARIDLYGDSYGTFFVQVFAGRHPDRVRSVVLDGAYPAIGGEPWYSSTAPAIAQAFDTVCRRSPQCAALGGGSTELIRRLVRALRVPGAPVTPSQLAFVMDSAGLDPLPYRELGAAARAFLDAKDALPLRRLATEAYRFEERAPESPAALSQGLFVAASCSDNPQAYDMRLPPSDRERQWQRVLAEKRSAEPGLYAPFALDEFLSIPLDYAYVPLCQSWPVASSAHAAGHPLLPDASMPNVPALVLTGDLDTITTPAEGDAAAALFPGAQRVIVANTGHVTAVGDPYDCASVIVRRFMDGMPMDASCAQKIPAVHLVPAFARDVSDVAPAHPIAGSSWTVRELRIAAAAVYAAADALARVQALGITHGDGLRGGRFLATTARGATAVTLNGVKWTQDLEVDGIVTTGDGDRAEASLRAAGMRLRVAWRTAGSGERAAIELQRDGSALRATMPAP